MPSPRTRRRVQPSTGCPTHTARSTPGGSRKPSATKRVSGGGPRRARGCGRARLEPEHRTVHSFRLRRGRKSVGTSPDRLETNEWHLPVSELKLLATEH